MSIEEEREEIMLDMLYGPPIIYVVMVTYHDDSTRCFVFSTEENMVAFIQIVEETGEENNVVKYAYFQSLLDLMYDFEYEMYGVEH
ncbi:MAG: hypothetical protein CMF22_10200 [Idiomarinaceae bacterium]|nr:hypothetical protein [Idiomarinaceae bacterium]MBG23813.1 hypothetical protein [Idiomarinaceae bacterium]|tara:strand:- start:37391 stop:37648 length:258 start_codon:yes stop_codon:yes gene_type:complete